MIDSVSETDVTFFWWIDWWWCFLASLFWTILTVCLYWAIALLALDNSDLVGAGFELSPTNFPSRVNFLPSGIMMRPVFGSYLFMIASLSLACTTTLLISCLAWAFFLVSLFCWLSSLSYFVGSFSSFLIARLWLAYTVWGCLIERYWLVASMAPLVHMSSSFDLFAL